MLHVKGSIGEVHDAHAASHGLQKPLALEAKPVGHAAKHMPWCMRSELLLASHERQLALSAPSHVLHVDAHDAHIPPVVTKLPVLHALLS